MHVVNFVIKYFVDSKDTFKLNIIVYKILWKDHKYKKNKTKQNKKKNFNN